MTRLSERQSEDESTRACSVQSYDIRETLATSHLLKGADLAKSVRSDELLAVVGEELGQKGDQVVLALAAADVGNLAFECIDRPLELGHELLDLLSDVLREKVGGVVDTSATTALLVDVVSHALIRDDLVQLCSRKSQCRAQESTRQLKYSRFQSRCTEDKESRDCPVRQEHSQPDVLRRC